MKSKKDLQQLNLFQTDLLYYKMIEEVQDYAILMMDRNGNIKNWNRGAEKIKGYKESEILGKNFSLFYLPHDVESKLPQRLITEAAESGRATHEGWRLRKDGTTFWGNVVITALHDDDDNIIGFTKVTRDLTERKLAEDQKERDARAIEIQNRQLEEFAYITSHDLQEPIRKIQTFINLIQRNIDDRENLEKYLDKMNTSANRMVTLIKDVLNFSRLSSLPEEFETVDLNQIVSGVLSDFELLISERDVTIECGNLPVVHGIPVQLTQLFSNLINNAIKFNDKRPVITITTELTEVPNPDMPLTTIPMHVIKLTDNGIGFDQDNAEKVFQPFRRLTSKFQGTGIGLALCKRIAENHQGTISANSQPGIGTVFTLRLPHQVV